MSRYKSEEYVVLIVLKPGEKDLFLLSHWSVVLFVEPHFDQVEQLVAFCFRENGLR